MKVLGIIKNTINHSQQQWQFDKIMAAIAFDLDLTIVFCSKENQQFVIEKMWNSLPIYGVDQVYCQQMDGATYTTVLDIDNITTAELKKQIAIADIIL
jgi:hypothetical protein